MITVVVADDSALVRRLVAGVIDEAPGIQVVGTAHNGAHAIEKIAQLQPDLLTLDIEMPVMDGVTAMKEIHRRFPRLPVIMVSTLTHQGAAITLDALTAGARDYVTKPTNSASLKDSLGDLSAQLVPRIRALTARRRPTSRPRPSAVARPAAPSRSAASTRTRSAQPTQLVAIGSSTGGPDALARVLGSFATRPAVPIVAVQHMPPVFTEMLAQRLDRLGPIDVMEAADGQLLQPGCMYLAPGGRHLEVVRRGHSVFSALHDGEPENYSKPSVDVLFRSVARAYQGGVIAVILTGMGHDGRDGCADLHSAGSLIVAQDQASAVVWGMPGAVHEAGLADATLDLGAVGSFVAERLPGLGTPRPAATGVA